MESSRSRRVHVASDDVLAARRDDRVTVFAPSDHDLSTRDDLIEAVTRAALLLDVDPVLDLSGVAFMDASTVGAILDAADRLESHGRVLRVRSPSTCAQRLLDLCSLCGLIEDQPSHAVTTGSGNVADAPRTQAWRLAGAGAPAGRERRGP